MAATLFHDEGSRLRKLAQSSAAKVRFRVHAKARMQEYCISRPEVIAILKRGAVVNVEFDEKGNEKWTAQGRLISDGRLTQVVVHADEIEITIAVITVIDKTVSKHR